MNRSELLRVESYLRRKFDNNSISLKEQKNGSCEVELSGEFIGVVFRDDQRVNQIFGIEWRDSSLDVSSRPWTWCQFAPAPHSHRAPLASPRASSSSWSSSTFIAIRTLLIMRIAPASKRSDERAVARSSCPPAATSGALIEKVPSRSPAGQG